jgi:hypothetical protein
MNSNFTNYFDPYGLTSTSPLPIANPPASPASSLSPVQEVKTNSASCCSCCANWDYPQQAKRMRMYVEDNEEDEEDEEDVEDEEEEEEDDEVDEDEEEDDEDDEEDEEENNGEVTLFNVPTPSIQDLFSKPEQTPDIQSFFSQTEQFDLPTLIIPPREHVEVPEYLKRQFETVQQETFGYLNINPTVPRQLVDTPEYQLISPRLTLVIPPTEYYPPANPTDV